MANDKSPFNMNRRQILLGSAALALSATQLRAAELGGSRVEAIVPFGEGGGADSYIRYMARVLEKKLPGSPSIVIRNVPGGGSVVGANYFDKHAKTDGTTIALASTSTTLTYAMRRDNDEIQFAAEKWIPFLASPVGRVMYINGSVGVKNLEDLKKNLDKELAIGLQSPTGSDMPTLLSYDMLGLKTKPIFGMDGGDSHLAFQRGELQINGDVTPAFLQMAMPLVNEGKAYPLFTFGLQNDAGEIVRDPNFPDLPTFIEAYEFMHGKKPGGPVFEAWKTLFQMAVMNSKVIVLPAGTPDEIVAIYDEGVKALIADPEFQKESVEFIGNYPQLTGQLARKSLVEATTISDEARNWVKDWLKTKYDAEF